MKIDALRTGVSAPVASRPSVSSAAAQAKPRMAADGYQPTDVRVITFNTAIGNPDIKTNQADFLQLPFYKAVIDGKPGAPILALQEVGNAQRDAVMKAAASGNFYVLAQKVGLRGRQNNMILIPKRFEVEQADNKFFGLAHLKGVAKSLWGWAKGGFKGGLNLGQLSEPRGFQELRLKDTLTGKRLTVFNTHTSYYDALKVEHNKQLFAAARSAAERGPVIVAGDLNTRTADTDPEANSWHDKARAHYEGFQDMGPGGTPPGKTNIDWVLAKGFESVSSRWYTGTDIALPGSPDAKTVSDHYAEEDVLRFK